MPYYPGISQLNTARYMMRENVNGLGIYLDGVEVGRFNNDKGFAMLDSVSGYIATRTNQCVLNAFMGQYDGTVQAGEGFPMILGVNHRSGLVANDGAPVTLYAIPAGIGAGLFRVSLGIFATAYTSGTLLWTLTYTENGGSRTLSVQATAVNVLGTATAVINPDASSTITVQLTGFGVATVKVGAMAELIAHG